MKLPFSHKCFQTLGRAKSFEIGILLLNLIKLLRIFKYTNLNINYYEQFKTEIFFSIIVTMLNEDRKFISIKI